MKLLHTSDWHLGRMLYAKKERYEEHGKFFAWLLDTIKDNAVDALLISGDVFDSAAPSNISQKMYYDFLLKVRNCGCRNVVVVGGNHDSPSLLDAPKEILSVLNVKVVGRATENAEDEVLVLYDEKGKPEAIICAVPFLRERDISRFTGGESYADRSKRIAESIRKHYQTVAEIAEEKQKEIGGKIPIIATGHLSVAGGKTVANDGVRDTYIGAIECVGSDIFPEIFDYVALGHFHIASVIGANENIRYCGSPIPMGFGEANQTKSVVIVDFDKHTKNEISIPRFQKLESICGDKDFISKRLSELNQKGESVWVEIIYDGNELFPDLQHWVMQQVQDSAIEVLKIQNRSYLEKVLTQADLNANLDEVSEYDVFDRLLADKNFPAEQTAELKTLYKEIVLKINEPEEGI